MDGHIQQYTSKPNGYYIDYTLSYDNNAKQYLNHVHNFCEILFVASGTGIYGTDEYTVNLEPYDLIVSPTFQYHFIDMDFDKPYKRFAVYSTKKELNALLDSKLSGVRGVMNIKDNQILRNYYAKLGYCFDIQNKLAPKLFDRLMRHNVEELIILLTTLAPEDFNKKGSNTNYAPIITEIVNYISDNLATVSIKGIAQTFHISQTYVYILFKKHFLISPSDYIISKRLAYASSLIADGEKLQNAAYICGYQNYSSFYRAYIKYFGAPPSQTNQ